MEKRKIDWGAAAARGWRSQGIDVSQSEEETRTPALPQPTPEYDAQTLDSEWLRVRREVELAMVQEIIPGKGWVFDPRLDILRARIRERWASLTELPMVAEVLTLVRGMHDHPSAAIFGYAFLRAALLLRGDSYRAEEVVEFEVVFLTSLGLEPDRSSHLGVTVPEPEAIRVARLDDEDEF